MKDDEASRPRMWPWVREEAIWAVKGPSPQPMSRILSVGFGLRYDRTVVVSFGTKPAALE